MSYGPMDSDLKTNLHYLLHCNQSGVSEEVGLQWRYMFMSFFYGIKSVFLPLQECMFIIVNPKICFVYLKVTRGYTCFCSPESLHFVLFTLLLLRTGLRSGQVKISIKSVLVQHSEHMLIERFSRCWNHPNITRPNIGQVIPTQSDYNVEMGNKNPHFSCCAKKFS